MTNNTTSYDESVMYGGPQPQIPILAVVVFAATTITGFIVNLIFSIVCVKTLKKTFHNKFVISLCANDSYLSLTGFLFFFTHSKVKNEYVCQVYSILMIYGLNCSYGLIFLIAVARFCYFVFQNPVRCAIFEKHQNKMLLAVHIYCIAISTSTCFLPRQSNQLDGCTGPKFLGDYYSTFLLIGCTGMSILLFCTLIMYAIICYRIVSSFSKKQTQVEPYDPNTHCSGRKSLQNDSIADFYNIEVASAKNPRSKKGPASRLKDSSSRGIGSLSSSRKQYLEGDQSFKPPNQNVENSSFHRPKSNLTNRSSIEEKIDELVVDDIELIPETDTMSNHSGSQTNQPHPFQIFKLFEVGEGGSSNDQARSMQHRDVNVSENQNISSQSCTGNDPTSYNFEKRACITSLMITLSTVVLTGPYLFTVWYDVFIGSEPLLIIRYLSFTLNGLSFCLDPVIYAWRVPSIKKELVKNVRKLLCKQTAVVPLNSGMP